MADISKITLPNNSEYYLKDATIAYGTCPTAAGTAAKVVTLTDNVNFRLKAGAIIGVKFSYTNTASNVTLNVNNTGAKSIWQSNSVYTGSSWQVCGGANHITFYMYDGTNWVFINDSDNFHNTDTYPSVYCGTAAGTAEKVGTCTNYNLLANSYAQVLIVNSNTSATALTLNINSKGAKPIYINGVASSTTNHTLPAGMYIVYYDGTNYYFRMDGILPTGGVSVENKAKMIYNNITQSIDFIFD